MTAFGATADPNAYVEAGLVWSAVAAP